MNAEEIRRAATEPGLTKNDILKTLEEELYRVPFRTVDSEDAYPVKVERFGKNSIDVHISDGTKFTLKVE